MEKVDRLSAYGYLVFALDALYLEGEAVTDEQRDKLLKHFKLAFDGVTEEDAISYYIQNSNTNIKF